MFSRPKKSEIMSSACPLLPIMSTDFNTAMMYSRRNSALFAALLRAMLFPESEPAGLETAVSSSTARNEKT